MTQTVLKKAFFLVILIFNSSCDNSIVIKQDADTRIINNIIDESTTFGDSLYDNLILKKEIIIDTNQILKRVFDFRVINLNKFVFIEIGILKSIKIFNSINNFTNILDAFENYYTNFQFSKLDIKNNKLFVLDDENKNFYIYDLDSSKTTHFKFSNNYNNFISINNNILFRKNYFNEITIEDFIEFDLLDIHFNKIKSYKFDIIRNKNLLMFLPFNMFGMLIHSNNLLYISPDSFHLFSIDIENEKINFVNNTTIRGINFAKITDTFDLDRNIELMKENSLIRKLLVFKNKYFMVLTFQNLILYDINGNLLNLFSIRKNELIDVFNDQIYIFDQTTSKNKKIIKIYDASF